MSALSPSIPNPPLTPDVSFISDDYVCRSENRISISFHLNNRLLDIKNIFREVQRAREKVADLLGHDLKQIDIYINNSVYEMRQDGRSRSRYASWIAGIFDGKIRVVAEREDDDSDALYTLLTHEIIHLAVSEMSKGKCPYWLDEGLAVSMSGTLNASYLAKLNEAAKKDAILPLEALEYPLPPHATGDLRKIGYAQCSSLAEYLVETHGWATVRSFVFESAVRSTKAILADKCLNSYLLELSWKRWLLGRPA